MHSYAHLWDEYISEDNEKMAIAKASLGKRQRPSVARYYLGMMADDKEIMDRVHYYATHFKCAHHIPIEIYDGIQRKKRTIIVPTFPEQIIHHMIVQTMKPIFMRGMYPHSFGSIPGRGMHNGKAVIEKWIRNDSGRNIKYCLQMDIHHFFASIPHDILKDMLRKRIHDDRFLTVLFEVIDATDTGLPLGFYTSQWLANWYLQGLDHYIKEDLHTAYYARYMDDMVIFGSSKKKLHWMRKKISEYLEQNLGLELKDTWQVFRFHNTDRKTGADLYRPLDLMGFRFYRNRTTLRKSIMLKAERKAKRVGRKKGHVTAYDARQCLSYLGYIDCTDTYSFYEERIKPHVSYRALRKKVSNADKRRKEFTWN